MKRMLIFMLLLMPVAMMAQSTYDQRQPFGFATVNSRTENVSYTLTGGGAYTYPEVLEGDYVVLTASGNTDDKDRNAILNAISTHAIVILDGSAGDFIITRTMDINTKSNKTILGINNARLCTKWYVTPEIKEALDAAGVPSKESRNKQGGVPYELPNGEKVKEEREYYTRKTMLELTHDNEESYTKSGVFKFSGCSNIIVRNIKFVGPGPIDCGGQDLMWFNGTTHAWVDHCEFSDGLDGNFDITNSSDFVTVSWCKFYYTGRAYDHMNTNLVGGDDNRTADTGLLNVTFAYNQWGSGCKQRMPMARYGKIHVLNNYYTCAGNNGNCINPRKSSEFLIEGNNFISSITSVFGTNDATAWVWSTSNPNITSVSTPSSSVASVSVPYTYSTDLTAANVPTEVGTYAGAILYAPSTESPTITTDLNSAYEVNRGGNLTLSIAAYPVTSYQWYKNGEAIVGETEASYEVNTSVASANNYYCIATNSYATGTQTATSTTATVTVNDAAYVFTNPKKFALSAGSGAVASGTTVDLKDGEELLATLTYGEAGGNDFKDPKADATHVMGYTAFTEGNETNGNQIGGTFYTIVPKYDAVISVAVVLNADKNFYILEDGVAMSGYDGITVTEKYYGTFEFKATANKSYKFYCSGSKLGFYGFEMRPYTEVTLGTGGYSTYASEKDFSVVGAKVYKAQDNGESVTLTEMPQDTRYKAGEGIVLKGTEGAKAQIAYTSIAATALTENDMVGVIESTVFTNGGNVYVIATLDAQTRFYRYTGDTFPAGKAYLAASGSGGTDSLPVNFEEVTAVNVVSAQTNTSKAGVKKYFENGKLIIESNGVKYNTTGARVK